MPKRIPLHSILAAQLAAQMIAIASIVSYLSYRSGEQAVENLAGRLMEETGDRVSEDLDRYLQTAHRINRSNIAALQSGTISLDNLDGVHNYLMEQHRQLPEISTLLFGTPRGEFRTIHWVSPAEIEAQLTQIKPTELPLEAGRSDASSPSRLNLYAVDEAGNVGRYLQTIDNIDVRERPWYRRAKASKTPGWSEPFQIGASNLLALNAYAPVYDDSSGELAGVFSVNVSLERLNDFLATVSVSQNGEVFIVERNGLLIADSAGEFPYTTSTTIASTALEYSSKPGQIEFHRLAARNSTNSMMRATARQLEETFGSFKSIQGAQQLEVNLARDWGSEKLDRLHFLRVIPYQDEYGLDWLIVIVVPQSDFLNEIQANVRRSATVCGLVLVGSVIGGFWLSKRITRSLERLNRAIRDLQAGKPLPSLETTPILEVAALSRSFLEMVASVRQANQLRQNYQQDLERQVAQQTAALHERSAQLQQAQRIAHVGSWELNVATGKIAASEEWFRILGCTRDRFELSYPEILHIVYPQERESLRQAMEIAIAHGMPYQVEHRIFRLNGTIRFVVMRGEPLFDSQGQLVKLVGTTTDITDRRQAEIALQESEKQLQLIADSVPGCICYTDSQERYRFVNRTCEDWFGRSKADLLGRTIKEVIGSEAYHRAQPYIQRVLSGERVAYEAELPARGKQTRYISAVLVPDVDDGARVKGYYTLISDISNLKRAEAAMRRQLAAMEAAIDGIAILEDEIFLYANQAHLQLFGYQRPEDLLGKSWRVLYSPQEVERFERDIFPLLDRDRSWQGEAIAQRADGSTFYEGLSLTLTEDGLLICVCRDISHLKQAREQILHQALHDPLTGLANRKLLTERLEEAIARAKHHEKYNYAVLFIDLDRFKVINDSLGHGVGDQLLVAIAHRLETQVRHSDLVARLGGDEFVILLEDIGSIEEVVQIAERLLETFQAPFLIEGQEIPASLSVGIALGNRDYLQATDLMRDADISMYRAKQQRSGSYQLFDESMYARVLHRHTLETQLRQALEREEFVIHYQPIFELLDKQLVGFEALVRWQHPTRGLIAPDEFIPVAEETDLIIPLDALVFEQACRQMAAWKSQFTPCASLKIGINLSTRNLRQTRFLEESEARLAAIGLDGDSIILEITESLLMDDLQGAIALLDRIKSSNMHISVDDFGTGHSCLGYLHRFPLDNLNIDRAFVHQLQANDGRDYIVETIVALGKKLGLSVSAEGIETPQQLERLQKLGCQYGQGYFFSQPLPTEAIESLYLSARN